MRTISCGLILSAQLAGLIAILPAQAPSSRPQVEAPMPTTHSAAAPTMQAVTDARDGLGNQSSERVYFDQPTPTGPLWAVGSTWKASFDATGFTMIPFFGSDAPQNFPLRLELQQVSVGGEVLPLSSGEPVEQNAIVRTDRGALTEVVATDLKRLEQSFVFDKLQNRGAIAVDVRIETGLAVSTIAGGLRFANAFGHVDYTKAIAIDAKGTELQLDIAWTGGSAHIEIPAAFVEQATLPIVLDPVLNSWFALGSSSPLLQRDSDVASFQALGGRTLLIWKRQWSATDQDCWGLMFDGNLGLVQTDFPIDFTNEDWLKVAVASNNFAQNFLVVSEVRTGLLWYIGGRTVGASANVGNFITIEREGILGTPGNNFRPDVGGDPTMAFGRYCVVFEKRAFGTSADVYMKQLSSSGVVTNINATPLGTTSTDETRPSISKSCGNVNGAQHWLATWQRTWPFVPFDQDVQGRFVGWNGTLIGGVVTFVGSSNEETAPSSCSPIDANGVRLWPLAYENATAPGQPRDVFVRLCRVDGTIAGSLMINTPVPGVDERDPEIDSDGTRFLTCYTGLSSSGNPSEQVVLTAYLHASNTFRTDFSGGLASSSLDTNTQMNVHADFSGGPLPTPRYVISYTKETNNTFNLAAFGGYSGGTNFFTTRPSQCGTLSIAASGSPVIGQSVTITLGNGALSATILGFPGVIPLNVLGCNCWQGVTNGIYLGNPLVWAVPNNPQFVGITLSAQGFTIVGSQCLNLFDLSDTVDFTIR